VGGWGMGGAWFGFRVMTVVAFVCSLILSCV
jgi:hypothetical protein